MPHTHGEWLASHVPTAHPHLSEDHGHLSLAWASIGEILDDLLERISQGTAARGHEAPCESGSPSRNGTGSTEPSALS